MAQCLNAARVSPPKYVSHCFLLITPNATLVLYKMKVTLCCSGNTYKQKNLYKVHTQAFRVRTHGASMVD